MSIPLDELGIQFPKKRDAELQEVWTPGSATALLKLAEYVSHIWSFAAKSSRVLERHVIDCFTTFFESFTTFLVPPQLFFLAPLQLFFLAPL